MCAGGVAWPTPAAPLRISCSNLSLESSMPWAACVRVSAPLIPLVALVLLPPKNEHLSSKSTLPPCSNTVCAVESPARPPPTTMICSHMAPGWGCWRWCVVGDGVFALFKSGATSGARAAESEDTLFFFFHFLSQHGAVGSAMPTMILV